MPRVAVGDVQLYYESYGSGPPVLLISGTAMSGAHWKLCQVPALAPHFRVILFDHRGTGRSDRPDEPYATRLFAQDALGLLDAIGVREPAHLIGHSMGGRVAQWIVLDHLERVRSLVLAASGSGQIDPGRPYPRGIPFETAVALAEHGFDAYLERHLAGSMMFVAAPPELVERFLDCNRGELGTDLRSYLRHVIARQEHETTGLLDRIQVPVLVIDGEHDTHPGGTGSHLDASRYLAARLPNAQLTVIPGGAHGFLYECAEETNAALLAFLRAH